ncbi:MAG TPA: M50 family metallopeptidase [bacterium]|jgi:regulator of sigma E protease
MLLTIASFIVTIGIIVTIHEFGHFLAARLMGMRVKRFSIGFPPKMFSKKIGDTEFAISWIPLGGYVQIAGMVDESMDDEGITGAPDEFMSKPPLARIFVLSAGVLMNYITAFLMIAALTLAIGVGHVVDTTIGEVLPDMPAATAGIQAGDHITAVNGVATPTWEKVVENVSAAGDSIALTVHRETGEDLTLLVPTKKMSEGGVDRRVIGIAPKVETRPAGLGDAVGRGWTFCAGTTRAIGQFIAGLATGESSVSQLSGPLGVAKLSGESAREGSGAFLFFIAYVSVSIAFLNILPFPALDGGHIMYVIIEAITRRPIPTRVKLWIQQVGMALLLLLVLFVSYHDIVRMIAD